MTSVTIAGKEYVIYDNYVTCAGVHVLNYDSRTQVMFSRAACTRVIDPASNVDTVGVPVNDCNHVIFAGAETVTRLDAGGVSEFAGGVVNATTYFMQMGALYVVYSVDSTLPIAVKQERPADQRYTAQQIAHAWSAAFDTETTSANTARADYTEELSGRAARIPRALIIAAGIWAVINIVALVTGVYAVARGDISAHAPARETTHGSFLLAGAGADAASDNTDDYLKRPLLRTRVGASATADSISDAITNFLAFAHTFSLVFIFCVLTSECAMRVV